jgi:hypothetical protein
LPTIRLRRLSVVLLSLLAVPELVRFVIPACFLGGVVGSWYVWRGVRIALRFVNSVGDADVLSCDIGAPRWWFVRSGRETTDLRCMQEDRA